MTCSVLIVRRRYTPYGGAEKTTSELARRLAGRGVRVAIAASHWEGDPAFEWIRISSPRRPSWLGSLVFALRCRKEPRFREFDLVLSLERTLKQDVYRAGDGCHRSWLRRRRVVDGWLWGMLVPALRPYNWITLWLERRVFDPLCTGLVVANSDMVMREIVENYRFPEDRIVLIRNGVTPGRFGRISRTEAAKKVKARLGIDPAARLLLFLGSGFHRKGLGYAIDVLANLRRETVLLVVGKGRAGAYASRARKLGLNGRVRFLGPVEEPDLYLLGADLLLLPTIYDPSSNACLEALAAGTPVVTTAGNGASEVVRHGETGWVVEDPRDVEDMAEGCRFLMDRDGRGNRPQHDVPGWDETVDRLLESLISRQPGLMP